MISDHQLVLAAKAAYDPLRAPFFQAAGGALRVFLDQIDGVKVFTVEGTHDEIGWAIDFVAIPEEDREAISHASLGWMHAGFFESSRLVVEAIRPALSGDPYILNGHSLGAAVALGAGGLMINAGRPPSKIAAFAPPRVGGDMFVATVQRVPISAYRYADDPIPCVPFTLRDFPYRQLPNLVQIGRASFARAVIDPFTYHHVERYVADVP